MLVLGRKPGEDIFINKDIRITVVSIRGQQVKIGIQAPSEYKVLRGEIMEKEDEKKEI